MKKREIDLHGLKHEEAKKYLIQEIEKSWNTECDLTIITGHSDRMKEIVRTVLKEYKLDIVEPELWQNRGCLKTVI